MEYIHQQTNIRIPAVRRSVRELLPDEDFTEGVYDIGFVAMEHVRGSTLRIVWPSLSLWNK